MSNKTYLVIVESPAKCKKIEKFLSKKKEYNFIVKASYGHITELKEKLSESIDIENKFKPHYIISPGKKKVVKELIELSKQNNTEVVIATDPDREGEAIGYHLIKTMKLNINNTKRIFFNQITEKAVLDAFDNPVNINMNLVNAQQSRCILDKLVGYEISPVLWKHIKTGLSAGRCQTPALRLLTQKENEIKQFNKQSYYKITGDFILTQDVMIQSEIDTNFENKDKITKLLTTFQQDTFHIKETKKNKSIRNPSAPFTTSTLQQDASTKLGISPKECMSIAQKLYENGYITYMRTDSVELSKDFIKEAGEYIQTNYGDNYLYQNNHNRFKNKSKNSQEAHEAVRPVKVDKINLPNNFNTREKNLYKLIWNRSVASLMTSQNLYIYKIFINTKNTKETFISQYEETIFDGFSRLYLKQKIENNKDTYKPTDIIKLIKKEKEIKYKEIKAEEKYTKPIPRYTEASLIKELEKLGIGRPSTYSGIITKIQDKKYVEKKTKLGEDLLSNIFTISPNKKNIHEKQTKIKYGTEKDKLFVTPIGSMVNDFVEKHFTDQNNQNGIFDYQMTSNMEDKLDNIANGKLIWTILIQEIYNNFHPIVTTLSKKNTTQKDNNNNNNTSLKFNKVLGNDKDDGMEIGITIGKNDYIVYKKSPDFKTKWKFANINELNKEMEDITLEDAIHLLRFPKDVGIFEKKKIILNKGPYGLYITYNKKNYPVDKENILLKDAINIIQGKVTSSQENMIGEYLDKPILFKKGKFGFYISHHNINYPIDKKIKSIDDITLEKAIEFINKKNNTFQKVINKEISIRENKKGNGYYIMYKKDNKSKPIFISIPKDDKPDTYDLKKCQELIEKH